MGTTRRILLIVEFDGTDFHGWQTQASVRTVQTVLTDALRTMTGEATTVRASSRTDAGVHARGMPVTFVTETAIPPKGFLLGLGSLLPPDASISAATEMPPDFDARAYSLGKTYRYRILTRRTRSALHGRYSWLVHRPLDRDAMVRGASHLLGHHDFSSFRAAGCDSLSPQRHLYAIRIAPETDAPDILTIEVVGNAFLRNMVRILAGTLVDVGLGRVSPDELPTILAARDRTAAGQTAPAKGLFLWEVHFTPRSLFDAAGGEVLLYRPPHPGL